MSDGILVVDDSLTVRMNLHEALEQAGLNVSSCATALEARAALAAERYGLVILDVLLPDGDGTDLLKEVRADAAMSETSVMLLSTEAEVRDRVRGLTMGADEYVGKPYDLTYVVARARELLRARQAASPSAGQTILIIDDSLTFRTVLTEVFEDAGYKTMTAESGEAGLRLAADVRPAAIVVDGMLPGIDGATVIRRVRLDAALRRVPCLLLTATESKVAEIAAFEAGADAFVRKDADTAVVLARLGAILRNAGAAEDQSTSSLQAPKKVLAVDDSETYLQELSSSLRADGYEVVMARSGEQALELLDVQAVDCILLDLVMPGLGGYDVCRRIKSHPVMRHMPVLILTAREDQDSIIEGLAAGADDYISKSSDFQVLRARVLAQIRRKQFEDENRHIREQILRRELEANEARAARQLAETRAVLIEQARLKAEAADKAKSQFLAAMSHEIRTPMNGVVGVVELLMATNLSPEQREMVDIIRRSGVTLLDVINDILDHSKIEVGRMTIESVPFSLSDTVETTAQLMAVQAQSKPVEISCYVDPAIDEFLLGDPVRVRQIVLNIMGNAVKFTDRGLISIDVTAESISDERIGVRFQVADSGVGMAPEEQARLFQPFQQANFSTTRKYGGTGLGLSICKNLIELMGGEIGSASTPGQGSTFWFTIPFKRTAAAERGGGFKDVLSGLKVLVHTDAECRPILRQYLSSVGISVVESRDTARAPDVIRAARDAGTPVDLAIVQSCTGTDSAQTFLDALHRHADLRETKTLFVIPHLNLSAGQVSAGLAPSLSISSPIRRNALYESIAFAVGRSMTRDTGPSAATVLDFIAPSIDEAREAGVLVLVAEDSQTNQFVIRSQLQRLGIAAEFVSDGREAWDALTRESQRFGLLLTDCHMPFIDGYKLTGLIRDRELTAKSRHLPVIALTANALAGEADICRAAGMDDYLSKPTNLETLNAMIRKWLPNAESLRKPQQGSAPAHAAAPHADEDGGALAPPIDLQALSRLLSAGDDMLTREILVLFRESEKDTAIKLRELIEARDPKAVMLAAHAAKGVAQSAFATRLADVFAGLEASANVADWQTIGALVPKMDIEFEHVMSFIERYLARPAP